MACSVAPTMCNSIAEIIPVRSGLPRSARAPPRLPGRPRAERRRCGRGQVVRCRPSSADDPGTVRRPGGQPRAARDARPVRGVQRPGFAVDPQRLNSAGSLFLTRPSLAHYTHTADEFSWRAGELLDAIAAGTLSVTVSERYPSLRQPGHTTTCRAAGPSVPCRDSVGARSGARSRRSAGSMNPASMFSPFSTPPPAATIAS